jgi:hypothetical protein
MVGVACDGHDAVLAQKHLKNGAVVEALVRLQSFGRHARPSLRPNNFRHHRSGCVLACAHLTCKHAQSLAKYILAFAQVCAKREAREGGGMCWRPCMNA